MKFFIFLLLSFINLFGSPKTALFSLYQNGKYHEACLEGSKRLPDYQKDESYVSLYAFSCLQSDNIERIIPAIPLLNQTPDARANASYLALIFMQKQLLLQALYDQKKLFNVKFPSSSHLLSKIFDMYMNNPQESQFVKEYTDNANPRQTYKLYPAEKNGKKTIAIDEYYDKILVTHHIY